LPGTEYDVEVIVYNKGTRIATLKGKTKTKGTAPVSTSTTQQATTATTTTSTATKPSAGSSSSIPWNVRVDKVGGIDANGLQKVIVLWEGTNTSYTVRELKETANGEFTHTRDIRDQKCCNTTLNIPANTMHGYYVANTGSNNFSTRTPGVPVEKNVYLPQDEYNLLLKDYQLKQSASKIVKPNPPVKTYHESTPTTITLHWDHPTGHSNIDYYQIMFKTSATSQVWARENSRVNKSAKSFTVKDRQPGQTYYYAVAAGNKAGLSSYDIKPMKTNSLAAGNTGVDYSKLTSAGMNLSVSAVGEKATFSWTRLSSSEVSGYRVQVKRNGTVVTTPSAGSSASSVSANLKPGTYTATVQARYTDKNKNDGSYIYGNTSASKSFTITEAAKPKTLSYADTSVPELTTQLTTDASCSFNLVQSSASFKADTNYGATPLKTQARFTRTTNNDKRRVFCKSYIKGDNGQMSYHNTSKEFDQYGSSGVCTFEERTAFEGTRYVMAFIKARDDEGKAFHARCSNNLLPITFTKEQPASPEVAVATKNDEHLVTTETLTLRSSATPPSGEVITSCSIKVEDKTESPSLVDCKKSELELSSDLLGKAGEKRIEVTYTTSKGGKETATLTVQYDPHLPEVSIELDEEVASINDDLIGSRAICDAKLSSCALLEYAYITSASGEKECADIDENILRGEGWSSCSIDDGECALPTAAYDIYKGETLTICARAKNKAGAIAYSKAVSIDVEDEDQEDAEPTRLSETTTLSITNLRSAAAELQGTEVEEEQVEDTAEGTVTTAPKVTRKEAITDHAEEKKRMRFDVVIPEGTTVKAVIYDLTNGKREEIDVTEGKREATILSDKLQVKEGHEYALELITDPEGQAKRTLSGTVEVEPTSRSFVKRVMTSVFDTPENIRAKGSMDITIKGKNASAEFTNVPAGKKVNIEEVVETAGETKKLPIGTYEVTLSSDEVSHKVEQRIEPYYYDEDADLDGDGTSKGFVDFLLLRKGEQRNKYVEEHEEERKDTIKEDMLESLKENFKSFLKQ